jgi:transcription antitermination factor NusG
MTTGQDYPRPWFGIQTELKKEKIAAAHLEFKGNNVFLPMLRKRRQWSDRSVNSTSPLFPGYLFCRFESAKPLIVSTPGVVAILGVGKHPEPIPESEIDAIQTILRSGLPTGQHPYLRAGDVIPILDGPLKGIEGVLVK